MSTLGRNIVKARVDQGMKQKDLHEKAGISQRYLSAMEHDHVDPRVSIVVRLAHALGVDAGLLMQDLPRPRER